MLKSTLFCIVLASIPISAVRAVSIKPSTKSKVAATTHVQQFADDVPVTPVDNTI